MVIIDSDVLLLAFAYPKDERQKTNQKFLEAIQTAQPATTIYNVMETLGQLSFNLSADQLNQWQDWMANAYNLTIIWDIDENASPENWREIIYERPFQKMQSVRMAFMDALILSAAERPQKPSHQERLRCHHPRRSFWKTGPLFPSKP